jgi:hypothetical protein
MKEEINKDMEILKKIIQNEQLNTQNKNLNQKLVTEWSMLRIEYQELKTK